MNHRHLIAALALLSTAISASDARAGTALVVAVEDPAATSWMDDVRRTAVAVLRERGITPNEIDPVSANADAVLACARSSRGCGAALSRWAEDQTLLIAVDSNYTEQGSLEITLTGWLLAAETGKVLAVDRRFCEKCADDALEGLTVELVAALLGHAAAGTTRTVLRISSRPPGARVTVDNQPVGVTDLEYTVVPGDHVITVDKPGYAIETRRLTALAGETVDVDITLVGGGAVYVFTRSAGVWSQQAYIKASNTGAGDSFGAAVALSADGDTLVVGAPLEASNATGLDGSQSDNAAAESGAVYVFTRSFGVWSQQAYVKASNTGVGDRFGWGIALADDGETLAVAAKEEASSATGVGGNQNDNAAPLSGAVYLY